MLLLRGNDRKSKILLFEFDAERRIFYADEIPGASKEARMRSIQPIGDEDRIKCFAGRVYTTIRYCFLDIAQLYGMILVGILAHVVYDVQNAQLAVDGFLHVFPVPVYESTSLRFAEFIISQFPQVKYPTGVKYLSSRATCSIIIIERASEHLFHRT